MVYLTCCGLVTLYDIIEFGQIGSGDGLLPDGTKLPPEPMLTNHQWGLVAFTLQENFPGNAWDIYP